MLPATYAFAYQQILVVIAGAVEAEIASVAAFFESHGVFVHEFRRGDPLWLVRKILVRMMDMLRSGAIRPSIGPLAPLRD